MIGVDGVDAYKFSPGIRREIVFSDAQDRWLHSDVFGSGTLSSIPSSGGVPQHRWTVVTSRWRGFTFPPISNAYPSINKPHMFLFACLFACELVCLFASLLVCLFVCLLVCTIRIRTCHLISKSLHRFVQLFAESRLRVWSPQSYRLTYQFLLKQICARDHDRCLEKDTIAGDTHVCFFL